ncbi:receptor-like protein EIX2 [Hibiscus syriacus]|uniref:receptor-like protein EIX2 n=1 Tax=Hibiscus syriacus TaxID=106335 RepID=UPI0019223461|nr:receptor-like protein EIX2 [Hibiscus syriacus]
MIRFEPNSSWIPPFQCGIIELSQWHLGSKFPQWLKFQNKLYALDISHAGISDVVPTWFLNLSTQFENVNLSSNQLTGRITYLNVGNIVDLCSNRFFGPLPRLLSNRFSGPLEYLSLSRNLFSGSLYEFVCNSSMTSMKVLLIDTNFLSGGIPDCWNLGQELKLLNLGNNNLTGKIPSSLGDKSLEMLNLRNNSMLGELPSTLQNCTNLVVLDLSKNHFSGRIPAWIGDKLSKLVVLSLRSNNFDGHIPHTNCTLQSLQNLDLGHNNISGAIPKCFRHLSAMATEEKQHIYYSEWLYNDANAETSISLMGASFLLKGREDLYSTTLGLVTSIDLSANSFTGEIPKEFGTLIGLLSLNLSRNLLTGNIPDNIRNLKLMESLDLSMNQLHGEIPSSLSNLNFLNHFNVSYNNLTGQIPTGTQLQRFDNSSYMANYLCGPPLSKSCSAKGVPTDVTKNGSSSGRSKVNGYYC